MSYRAPDGLLRNVQQQRLTDKSEYLLKLEARQAKASERKTADPAFDDELLPALLRKQG